MWPLFGNEYYTFFSHSILKKGRDTFCVALQSLSSLKQFRAAASCWGLPCRHGLQSITDDDCALFHLDKFMKKSSTAVTSPVFKKRTLFIWLHPALIKIGMRSQMSSVSPLLKSWGGFFEEYLIYVHSLLHWNPFPKTSTKVMHEF